MSIILSLAASCGESGPRRGRAGLARISGKDEVRFYGTCTKGSAHPEVPELIYPLDYGYVTGLRSGDGDEVDVWIGSLKRRVITGVICTVDLGKRDIEVKILLGCSRAEQRRILSIHNRGNHRAVLIRAEAARKAAARRRDAKSADRG